jgi:eukaryotic-like serine/threonine-protein kinase
MRELLDALRGWQDDDIDDVTQLLKDRPMAAWGPLIDRSAIGLQVEDKLVMSTGLDEDVVAELLDLEPRRYLLLERLSDTHHATVYAALDALLNRDVVVKIHRDLRAHAMQLALRESQVLANVVHPNVVQIYDMGEFGRWLYSVIEPCELDLRQWHRARSHHWRAKLSRIIEAGHGLSYLHELGYAHGDIKPGNVLVQENTAKLSDFGHVTIPRAGDRGEGEGHGGTVGYVAPDVYRSGPSHAGDVFALAVTTFNLLFDGKPFGEAKTIAEGVRLVENGELRWPEKLPEGLPKSVLPLLVRALDADPDKRPSLREFLRGLQSAIDQRKRRLRSAAVSTAAAALLVVGASIGALLRPASIGDGSIAGAALTAIGPLARAELAMRDGDIDTAVDVIYRVYDRVDGLSAEELIALADGIDRMAQALASSGHDTDAWHVSYVAFRLYKRAGATQKIEKFLKDRETALPY